MGRHPVTFTCFVCTAKFPAKSVKRGRVRLPECTYQVLCESLRIPSRHEFQDVEFDTQSELRYCLDCAPWIRTILGAREEREKLEQEVLKLQKVICDKLRKLDEMVKSVKPFARSLRDKVLETNGLSHLAEFRDDVQTVRRLIVLNCTQ
jgi:hypothetical protein